jgi:hypothetical protein
MMRVRLSKNWTILSIFLLGGAVTMTVDRVYKSYKRRQVRAPLVEDGALVEKVEGSLLSEASAHKLYQIMQVTHEVFGELGITYWADGGTALGAVRNRGIVPTDDDLDVGIFEKDEARLMTDVKGVLNARGYTIAPFGVCYKILAIEDLKSDPSGGYESPECALDVFPFKEERPGVWVHNNLAAYKAWGDWCYKVPQTFPLRLVDFGPIKIYIPHDPEAFLYRAYGRWNQHAYITNYHKKGNTVEPFSTPMTPELRKPAPWRTGFEYIKGQPAPPCPKIDIAGEHAKYRTVDISEKSKR